MYKLDIRVDMKEAAATERRRMLEQQRKERIFNARQRTIGVRAHGVASVLSYATIRRGLRNSTTIIMKTERVE